MAKTTPQGQKPSSPSNQNPSSPDSKEGTDPIIETGEELEGSNDEGGDLGNPPEGIAADEELTLPKKEEKATSVKGEISGHDRGKTPYVEPKTDPTVLPEAGKGGPNEDGSFSAYTYPGYEVKEKEKTSFHVELEQPLFSPTTGSKLSKPFIQKYNPQQFAGFFKTHGALGYKINKWLHQPETAAPRKRRAKRGA